MLLLGGCKGAEDARGVARGAGDGADKTCDEGGRVCEADAAAGRPRPKAAEEAAEPARCHPQGADICRPGWNAKRKQKAKGDLRTSCFEINGWGEKKDEEATTFLVLG